jgi:CubicO group peptidase (beta-lactamase class C family)
VWAAARGWANLERAEVLDVGHRFPAYGITHPVTATTVLRLVGDGRVGLDDPANNYLRTVRLADGTVTVRELLTHTGGVDHPAEPIADSVPELVSLVGPMIACNGERGMFHYSNEGYAALGQLIADVTGSPYTTAVDRLVLKPLRMRNSSFPARWPDNEPGAITGYNVTPQGAFASEPRLICTMPAAGGLWATAVDVVRFGLGWSTLLPEALAREALRPQAPAGGPVDGERGLGWLIDQRSGVMGSPGTGPGASTSLLIRLSNKRTHVALTNRQARIAPINERVLRARIGARAVAP